MSGTISSIDLVAPGRFATGLSQDSGVTDKPFRHGPTSGDGIRGVTDYSAVSLSAVGQVTLVSPAGRRLQLSVDHFGHGQHDMTSHEAGRLLQAATSDDGATLLHRLSRLDVCSVDVGDAACIHALLNRAETSALSLTEVAQAYERVSEVCRRAAENPQCAPERQALLYEEAAVVAMQAAQSYDEAKMPVRAAQSYKHVADLYRQIASSIKDQEVAVDVRAMAEGADKLEYECCLSAFDEQWVAPDGNCFFSALKASGELKQEAGELRRMVVDELRFNSASYAPFLETDLEGDLSLVASRLARDGEWVAGDMVPHLMSSALGRPIRVLDAQRKRTLHVLPREANCSLDPITIFYNGRDHYNAALPKGMDTVESAAGNRLNSMERNVAIGCPFDMSGVADSPYDFARFVLAQEAGYEAALRELRAGQKKTHWMWYMFPQVKGLGTSPESQQFAINSPAEAAAYLSHPVLGAHLAEMTRAVNESEQRSIEAIFGDLDAQKFHASMTLFAQVASADNPVFREALNKYFEGRLHPPTVEFLATRTRVLG